LPASVDTSPITADAFDLELVARLFHAQQVDPVALIACFKISTVFAVRPERPGFMVAAIPDMGRWVRVYSRLDYLGYHEGPVNWMSLLGADVLNLLPADVGLVLDTHLPHATAIPPGAVLSAGDAAASAPRSPAGSGT
jgi:hypothetical protein